MTIQLSEAARNARLDQIETTIGASAIMRIRSGAPPANCAAADTGTVLGTLNLPADWLAAASSGVKSKAGTWQDAAADAGGTAGHFRIYDSGGTVCGFQGTVTGPGGGGDLELQNISIALGQQITITGFDLTEGNA